MRKVVLSAALLVLAATVPSRVVGHAERSEEQPAEKPSVQLESLLKETLEGVDGIEVIVSRVTLPPHATLPKHWHPGEEFGYVIEGSVILWQEGKEEIVATAGDVVKIPLEQVHTAITKDEGATVLVFRVHEQGKPERVLVEGD